MNGEVEISGWPPFDERFSVALESLGRPNISLLNHVEIFWVNGQLLLD